MAPRYTEPQGKTIGLPQTWASSPTHHKQNVVHAEADWMLRIDKEDFQRERAAPATPVSRLQAPKSPTVS